MRGGGRILLIGDSVIRMARSALAKLEKCPVDLIASSYNLDDLLFVRLIDGFFDNIQYHYKVIFVQISHHGDGLQDLNCDPKLFDEHRYENNIRCLISFLSQYCDKIVLVSVMEFYRVRNDYPRRYCPGKIFNFLNKAGIIKHMKDSNKNCVVERRNTILKKLAEEKQVYYMDMEAELLDQHSYIVTDSIHPENKMKPYMAKVMRKYVS